MYVDPPAFIESIHEPTDITIVDFDDVNIKVCKHDNESIADFLKKPVHPSSLQSWFQFILSIIQNN